MRVLLKTLGALENLTLFSCKKCKQCRMWFPHSRAHAVLVDGVQQANIIHKELKDEVSSLITQGYPTPHLTTVLVGDDHVSHLYIKRKTMAARAVGISIKTVHLKNTVTEQEMKSIIVSLNNDENVHTILVQLPLPNHICEKTICNVIVPQKDVDGFNTSNMGSFVMNVSAIWPCTAMAVQHLIQSTGITTRGKHAVICGRSRNVGLPIALMLQSSGSDGAPGMDATTTICHRFTDYNQLCSLTRSADILVSATGVPGLITSSMVKHGACVIDVGITRLYDHNSNQTRLVGDVDFEGVRKVAGFITPVPGGVGPMTVAMLLKNTLQAAKQQMGVI